MAGIQPVTWSASSLNTWHLCHLQWWFTYVLGQDGEATEAQSVGIAVHDLAEQALRGQRPDQSRVLPDVRLAYEVFERDILPTYGRPVLVEHAFLLDINGIRYSGVLDSVDERDSPIGPTYVLRDLKTTGSRPSRGRYRLPMTGYVLGAEQEGYDIDMAVLDYIVRTRTPYYWPEILDPIADHDVALLAIAVEEAAEGVVAGDWAATGLGTWACSWCPHKAVCGPYERLNGSG